MSASRIEHERGRELVRLLARCVRQAMLHDVSNAAVAQPVRMLAEMLASLARGGPLRISAREDTVYVDRELVKLDPVTFDSARYLSASFQRFGVREIEFVEPPGEAELKEWLSSLQRHQASAQPLGVLAESFRRIVLVPDDAGAGAKVQVRKRHPLLEAFGQLGVVTRRVLSRQRGGGELRLGRIRRAVQAVADASERHEPAAVALARMHVPGDVVSAHLVSTCVLSLLMARRLGLGRVAQSELGVSAVLHDLGRGSFLVSPDLAPPDPARAESARRRVCQKGVARLGGGPMPPLVVRCAEVAYEAALPSLGDALPTSPGAKLVGLACAFDLLTRLRPPLTPLSPADALSLLARAPARFDPRLVGLLATLVGEHPPGTPVRLSSGADGVVVGRVDLRVSRVATLGLVSEIVEAGPGRAALIVGPSSQQVTALEALETVLANAV